MLWKEVRLLVGLSGGGEWLVLGGIRGRGMGWANLFMCCHNFVLATAMLLQLTIIRCEKIMTASAWLLQFQCSLNRWVVCMVKGISKMILLTIPISFQTAQSLVSSTSVHMRPSAVYCPVQNQIIASRGMHMTLNWYKLASRQLSQLAL